MKKCRFNFIYNSDKNIGNGEGYYIIFEGHDKSIMVDSYYKCIEYNEQVDMISVGILNKIKYLSDIGYKFDPYFTADLKDLF